MYFKRRKLQYILLNYTNIDVISVNTSLLLFNILQELKYPKIIHARVSESVILTVFGLTIT